MRSPGWPLVLIAALVALLPSTPRRMSIAAAVTQARGGPPQRQLHVVIGSSRAETLTAVDAVPVEIAGSFEDPTSFQQAASGQYYVLDQRAQAVYAIDAKMTGAWKLVRIGQEPGNVYQPHSLGVGPSGDFAVADLPGNHERIQMFSGTGSARGGFNLPPAGVLPVWFGGATFGGIGSLQFDGRSILVSLPANGALFTEYGLSGAVGRTFGSLRATGHEAERDVHLALNAGVPLVNPRGGYYFVFQTGIPLFRKYDADGRMVFERHVEGTELDAAIAALPAKWPRREGRPGEESPVMRPLIRTAAVDGSGNLWIALAAGVTYVYSPAGDKIRVVQFRGAGIVQPTSMFFAPSGRLLVTPGCYEFKVS